MRRRVPTSNVILLARKPDGFVLMVESGMIDKYSHALDWERAVYDTIMLDNAVAAAKSFAAERDDTLIIVVADHAHPVSIIGTYDEDRPGDRLRDKLGVYDQANFPNYPKAGVDGYPGAIDVSRRLAFVFGGFPDHCTSGKPYLGGSFKPAPTITKDQRPLPDWPSLYRELKRPGVTLQLLWEEHRGRQPSPRRECDPSVASPPTSSAPPPLPAPHAAPPC
jgi:hypothetical protein